MPQFAVIIWPFIAIGLFAVLGPSRGLIWSVVVGYLFLPEFSMNTTGLPGYGKLEAIAIGAALGAFFTGNREPRPATSDPIAQRMFLGLVLLLLISPAITVMFNTAPVFFGPTVRKPLGLWDVQNIVLPLLVWIVPWLLARRFLHTPAHHRELLQAIVLVGLFYSILVLFELRMSPQINKMVYGFFPHSWTQHLRGGGFRPLVFLRHGLWLGFFLLTVVLAAVALTRADKEKRPFYLCASIWMLLVLLVSRNLGASVICLLMLPFVVFARPKTQIRVALLISMLFVINPSIRDFYIQPLLSLSEKVSINRSNSLRTRFDNETALIERANLKPITGWGHRSRWRVHDERGRDVTLADGIWVIVLSQRGWLGFIALFGLLIVPIVLTRRAIKSRPLPNETAVLGVMIGANLIYMIPNSTLSPIGWLVAGALAGFVQFAPSAAPEAEAESDGDKTGRSKQPVYTRFGPGVSANSLSRR